MKTKLLFLGNGAVHYGVSNLGQKNNSELEERGPSDVTLLSQVQP